MDIRNPEETCSTREAALALGISVRTAQIWVEEGRLKAWKTPGGHRRILRTSVDEVLTRRRAELAIPVHRFEILVVEDDPVQREMYETVLVRMGKQRVNVRTAESGYEALLLIGEQQPDLLVTDLIMPGIDGFGMLETLTKRPLSKPMQIVVATALDTAEIEARGGLPPGVSVFHKPVPYSQLIKLAGAYREIWAINENTISV